LTIRPEAPAAFSLAVLLIARRRASSKGPFFATALRGTVIPHLRMTIAVGYPEASMKVSDVMTPEVEAVKPDDTLRTAAELMADLDSSALPVGENDLLIGVITDRDITIRAVVEGRDPEKTTVRQAMSPEVLYCFDDENVADVSQKMGEWWVRRLPVVNQDKRLIGIVSLGDLAGGTAESEDAQSALSADC
jgi:CBS domain-containing protein